MASDVDVAINRSGGLGVFAERMGVSYQAVQKWRKSKRIPLRRVAKAEEVSGVSRIRLNPDLAKLGLTTNASRG